jgi:outer membrane murein-binding lipoprotein Lpp
VNIQEQTALRRTAEAALAMVQALAAQVDRLSQRVEELAEERRPRKLRPNDGEKVMD